MASETLAADHWVVWSNLFYLFPLAVCAYAKLPVRIALFSGVIVSSIVYHYCDSRLQNCVASFRTLYNVDSAFAITAMASVVLSAASVSTRANELLQLAFVAPPLVMAIGDNSQGVLWVNVYMATAVVVVAMSWAWQYGRSGREDFRRINWYLVLTGVLVAAGGFAIFLVLDHYPVRYSHRRKMTMHAFWHVLTAVGAALVIYGTEVWPRRNDIISEWESVALDAIT